MCSVATQQIVDFLAAIGGASRHDHAGRHPRMFGHRAADRRIGRIVGALDDEGHFVIVVVLPQQGAQVRLQVEIEALARREQSHPARSAWCGAKPRMQLRT